jgi:hypothetical protein
VREDEIVENFFPELFDVLPHLFVRLFSPAAVDVSLAKDAQGGGTVRQRLLILL